MAPKKRKKRRRVIVGSRSRRAKQKLNKRKESSSTESSSDGEEREEVEGEEEDTPGETSQSDEELHQVTVVTEEGMGPRLRARSHSGSTSDPNQSNRKRNWVKVSETSQEETEVEEEVGVDTKQLTPHSVVTQFRPKLQSSFKTNRDLEVIVASITSQSRDQKPLKKRKRIPYTLVEASKGNHCPTPGCDGLGHLTGMYAMHFAVSGCPKAHGKTPEECKARREELNRLRLKALPPPVTSTPSSSSVGLSEGYSERVARRVARVTGGNSPTTTLPSYFGRRSSSHIHVSLICVYTYIQVHVIVLM